VKLRIKVILFVLMSFPFAQGEAQEPTPATPPPAPVFPYHDPARARLLALFPGGGYYYTGQYELGFTVTALTPLGILGGQLVYTAPCPFVLPTNCTQNKGFTRRHIAGGALVAMGLGIWIASIVDAPASADRANSWVRHLPVSISPVVIPPNLTATQWRAGVEVAW